MDYCSSNEIVRPAARPVETPPPKGPRGRPWPLVQDLVVDVGRDAIAGDRRHVAIEPVDGLVESIHALVEPLFEAVEALADRVVVCALLGAKLFQHVHDAL